MAVLVIADHDGSAVRDTTNKTVTAALALSSDVDVLVVGENAQGVADAAAKISGVRKVLLAQSAGLGKALAEAVEATVLPLAGGYDAVLAPATTDGKNYAASPPSWTSPRSRTSSKSCRPTPSCARSTPAMRWRRSSRPTPRR